MANRPQGFGITSELPSRIDFKYSDEMERELCQWIETVTGQSSPQSGAEGLQKWLKDGIVLCNLINGIGRKPIKEINTSKMTFKQMENISMFLNACEDYGVNKADLFEIADLYEGTNMPKVLTALHALRRVSVKKGYTDPTGGN